MKTPFNLKLAAFAGIALGLGLMSTSSAAPPQSFSTSTGGSADSVPTVGALMRSNFDVINFEDFPAGTIVDTVYGKGGCGPIGVSAMNPDLGSANAALIFDSGNPTGEDEDLGSPNQGFGGPGQGLDGQPGSPFKNFGRLGKILIVAEDLVDADMDGLVDDPDDADNMNEPIIFDFSAVGPVTVKDMIVIDIEADEPDATAKFYDCEGMPISTVALPTVGDNGAALVVFEVEGVCTMEITLNGSGGLDRIRFSKDCTASIGDFVWHDLDRDGVQDPGEPGIGGVDVSLLNEQGVEIDSQTTGPDGLYLFEGLCAGDYTVVVDESTLPDGFVPSLCNVGDDTADNDCSPADVNLPDDGSEDRTVDFGYNTPCTGTIGDYVWNDLNRNGIQDAGEPGIEGVKITLYDGFGNVVAMVFTGPDGSYEFAGLCAGDYILEVDETTLPDDFVPSDCNVGGDDTIDNDCSPKSVNLPTDDSSDPTCDFGYNTPCSGSIGDFVWNDLDRDGIQDAGEPGIEGVKVILKDDMGQVIGMTTTGANGFYEFDGLCAGDYIVEVDPSTLPPDFVPSPCMAGMDDALDNNCSPTGVTLLTDGSDDETIDFGYNSPCSGTIGNLIWNDEDRDGIQDPGEPGLEGVTVILKDDQGSIIATVTTGPGGFYEFSGLCAGDYIVEVDPTTLPPDFVPSPCNEGMDDTVDNDCSPKPVNLPADDTQDDTCDFGYNSPCTGTIGNFVWEDLNNNFIQDPGEPGIEGVKVLLTDDMGQVIAEATTDANGFYEFGGLCAGTYKVEVDPDTVPNGFEPVVCDAGSDDTVDSDCPKVCVILETDDDGDDTVDFGFGPCNECDGKVSALTMRYLGSDPVLVEVVQKNGDTVFMDLVEPNGLLSFFGTDNGTFGNEIKIFVDGVEVQKIHTSCSDPIGPGLQFGEFEIIAGSSLDGGLLCDEGDNVCNGDKPKSLTMIYTGEDCDATVHSQDPSKVNCEGDPAFEQMVHIIAFKDDSTIYFDGTVELGDNFVIEAANAGENRLGSATFVEIYDLMGNLIQSIEFHTSCSQPLFIGNQFGSLVLEDFCPEGGGTEPVQDLCDIGDAQAVDMIYTGLDCTATSHSQDPSKVNCSGDPDWEDPVHIIAFKDSDIWFDGIVPLNGEFSIDAMNAGKDKLASQTFVEIYDLAGNLLQEIEFHTSCSQPLELGNQFGGLLLNGFTPKP